MPAASRKSASGDEQPASYEQALSELEELAARMESGDMPLEQLLHSYRRGAQLLKYCRDVLDQTQQQVQVLGGDEIKPMTGA